MKAVWKYALPYMGPSVQRDHEMPVGAEIIHVGMQAGFPHFWAVVDPSAPMESRSFQIVGTGHDDVDTGFEYIGTVQDGPYVWHFFEVGIARHPLGLTPEQTRQIDDTKQGIR